MPRDPYWTLTYRIAVLLQPARSFQEANRVPLASALVIEAKKLQQEH